MDNFFAPFVEQAKVKMAVEFVESYKIKTNDCVFVVGKIISVYYKDNLFLEDGSLDVEKYNLVSISGLNNYFCGKKIAKLEHTKQKK